MTPDTEIMELLQGMADKPKLIFQVLRLVRLSCELEMEGHSGEVVLHVKRGVVHKATRSHKWVE